jgi:hypothetical protein
MKTRVTVIYLVVAGLLLLTIGTAILFAPHAFHGSNGVALGGNPNLLSEIRAPGGLLFCSGFLILLGAFRQRIRIRAAQLTVLVYGSFGMARLVGVALDGMPSSSIVGAMLLELIVALVGLVIYWRYRTGTYQM